MKNKIGMRLFWLTFIIMIVILVKTIRFDSVQLEVDPISKIDLNENAVLDRLTQILQFETISYGDPERFNPLPFVQLRQYIQSAFPLVHKHLSLEVFGKYSLLYRLPGSDPNTKPIALMAHMDVVPIEEETRQLWTHPPFSGAIVDNIIWGRGSLDVKSSLIAILEATEYLLANNLKPKRDLYLIFGHDEELGGKNGVAIIAQNLKNNGVAFDFVLDEGGAITKGISSYLSKPVAMVATAEKGGVSVELSVNGTGGHSSSPPAQSTIGTLSRAIVALEENQMPASLDGATGSMFDVLSREMGFGAKMLFANRWITEPFLLELFAGSSSLNAMLRTTTAPTIIKGGIKDNVLPSTASAVINFRLRSGDTIDSVLAHISKVIDNPTIDITVKNSVTREASAISDHNSNSYKLIEKTIKQIIPGTLVAPGLLPGGTDSKHLADITDNIYHFVPYSINKENISAIHSVNERLPVSEYTTMIRFYAQLISEATK